MKTSFIDIHVKRSAKPHIYKGKSIASDQDLHWRYKCGICGWPAIDSRRDGLGEGDGYQVVQNPDGTFEQKQVGGCGWCHTRNWL